MAWIKTVRQTILSYSMDLRTELQATEYYLVFFDAPASPIQAETAQGVPRAGDGHPDDPIRLFKQKRPQCLENSNRMHWQVQVDFSSLIDTQQNPLLQPATFEWDYDNGTEAYFIDNASEYPGAKDGYGNAITGNQAVTNTSGEPLPGERDSGCWSATYSKNVAPSFTIAKEVNTMQLVNSKSFTFDGEVVNPFVAKISGGHLTAVTRENGVAFRTLQYKVKFNARGWIDLAANVGLQEMNSGKRVNIVAPAVTGGPPEPIQRPWPLDQDGVAYPDPTTTPDLLIFYPYHAADFAGMFPA